MGKRQQIAFGAALFLIGAALFARPYVPALEPFLSWPLLLVPLGLLGVVCSAILEQGGWLISAALITGIGANLWAERALDGGTWASMAAFLGLGLMLASVFDPDEKDAWRPGLILIVVSAVMFLLLGGKKYLPWPQFSGFWPLAIVLVGLAYILAGLTRKKKDS